MTPGNRMGGQTFRDWLNPKSLQEQYEWGLKLITVQLFGGR